MSIHNYILTTGHVESNSTKFKIAYMFTGVTKGGQLYGLLASVSYIQLYECKSQNKCQKCTHKPVQKPIHKGGGSFKTGIRNVHHTEDNDSLLYTHHRPVSKEIMLCWIYVSNCRCKYFMWRRDTMLIYYRETREVIECNSNFSFVFKWCVSFRHMGDFHTF
jgi:hypothetical protein